ncbi:hypothetical protein [Microbulbifer taiwanensis]|uniref:Uncharacterized protein n=1 Tax=Microbulbifer taiwanensis TaxID=986746 RepID=A0ABW1YFX3_9GAMM
MRDYKVMSNGLPTAVECGPGNFVLNRSADPVSLIINEDTLELLPSERIKRSSFDGLVTAPGAVHLVIGEGWLQ